MHRQFNISEFFPQAFRILRITGESYAFFKKNKLWKGIFEYRWVTFVTIILSVLFTYTLFSDIFDILLSSDPTEGADEDGGKKYFSGISKFTAIFSGSKYLMLILLEIVIFHFSVKTLEVLNKEKYVTTFGMFIKAEMRMIKVMIRSFIYTFIVNILLNIGLSILGFSYALPAFMFVVTSYFIGLGFLDNYNEQQKLNVKESDICIRYNSGAATTLGVLASAGLVVPIIGPLVVPVFGAIVANIYGHTYHIENPPHHKTEVVDEEEAAELV